VVVPSRSVAPIIAAKARTYNAAVFILAASCSAGTALVPGASVRVCNPAVAITVVAPCSAAVDALGTASSLAAEVPAFAAAVAAAPGAEVSGRNLFVRGERGERRERGQIERKERKQKPEEVEPMLSARHGWSPRRRARIRLG
jgi:hypothetical protein